MHKAPAGYTATDGAKQDARSPLSPAASRSAPPAASAVRARSALGPPQPCSRRGSRLAVARGRMRVAARRHGGVGGPCCLLALSPPPARRRSAGRGRLHHRQLYCHHSVRSRRPTALDATPARCVDPHSGRAAPWARQGASSLPPPHHGEQLGAYLLVAPRVVGRRLEVVVPNDMDDALRLDGL